MKIMRISVCITVFNEEKSISMLLESLLKQTRKPYEVVIVDGGSSDKTVDIIKHFQKKYKKIKLLVKKCSRSRGRNIAVEIAKSKIIAMTDAGCVAKKDWLERIIEPFKNNEIDVVAGFYDMIANNPLQKAMSVFLGTLPGNFDVNFLPSTRSIAFRKNIWEKVGGFPENLNDTAEDTMFNYKLVKEGMNIARVKNARVEWGMPKTLKEFSNKIYLYAKGDARSGVISYPTKGIMSHNLKSVYKLLRYLLGLALIIYAIFNPFAWILILSGIFGYSFWAFSKVYKEFKNMKVGLWGVFLQYVTDIYVIIGFLEGAIGKKSK